MQTMIGIGYGKNSVQYSGVLAGVFDNFFGGLKPRILSYGNRRYCKITSSSSTDNYGVIIFVASGGFMVITITGAPNPKIIIQSSDNVASVSKSGLTTTLDAGNTYSHCLVLIGGSLGKAGIVIE